MRGAFSRSADVSKSMDSSVSDSDSFILLRGRPANAPEVGALPDGDLGLQRGRGPEICRNLKKEICRNLKKAIENTTKSEGNLRTLKKAFENTTKSEGNLKKYEENYRKLKKAFGEVAAVDVVCTSAFARTLAPFAATLAAAGGSPNLALLQVRA